MSVPPFRATVAELGRLVSLVSVSGELDLYVEPELRAALADASKLDVQTIAVDLNGVTFLDSTVCGILVGASKKLREEGRELVLVSNHPRVVRVLDVAGIDRVIRVFPTLHGALEFLAQPV
jgi:anti-sigma B factor antagonist